MPFDRIEIPALPHGKRSTTAPAARLLAVPVLAAYVAPHGSQADREFDLDSVPVNQIIGAPIAWCPNPVCTNCLRVRGTSMAPLINDGDIVAVDCAQTDPEQLSGKLVVTWQRETGLVLSRFLFVNGTHLLGGQNDEFKEVAPGRKRDWSIIGRALWWISGAP